MCRYMQMCARDLDLSTVVQEASSCTGLDFERVRRWFYRAISQRRKSDRCGRRGRPRMPSNPQTSRAVLTGQPVSAHQAPLRHPAVQPDLSALRPCAPTGLPAAWNTQTEMQSEPNLRNRRLHDTDAEPMHMRWLNDSELATKCHCLDLSSRFNTWVDKHSSVASCHYAWSSEPSPLPEDWSPAVNTSGYLISAPASSTASCCSSQPSSPLPWRRPHPTEDCSCSPLSDIGDTYSSSQAELALSSALDEIFVAALDAYQ